MNPILTISVLLGLTACAAQPLDPVGQMTSGQTQGPDVVAQQRGAAYAAANCGGCHAVGVTGESPLPAAPHFRDLSLRYPIDHLSEAFAEGIDTAHDAMPEFVMSTGENSDLVAYLKSIQERSTR